MVELLSTLSNPEVGARLDRLIEALADLKPQIASHAVELRELPLAQGLILRTIKQVLGGYPEGLQAFEVKRCVELEIGRKLPKSTVKDALASNSAFERIGPGRYRLLAEQDSAEEDGACCEGR